MPTTASTRENPMLVAHFVVTVEGRSVPLLSVSELHDVIDDQPFPNGYQRLVLKRAVSTDRFLYNWYRDTRLGKNTSANLTVDVLDSPGGKTINRWGVENAKPVRWTGPSFNALGNELAMEELELVYSAVVWLD